MELILFFIAMAAVAALSALITSNHMKLKHHDDRRALRNRFHQELKLVEDAKASVVKQNSKLKDELQAAKLRLSRMIAAEKKTFRDPIVKEDLVKIRENRAECAVIDGSGFAETRPFED